MLMTDTQAHINKLCKIQKALIKNQKGIPEPHLQEFLQLQCCTYYRQLCCPSPLACPEKGKKRKRLLLGLSHYLV